ncbi:hypothetical protein BKA93DRAFT_359696 [Sparassis latifolia]
MRHEVYDQKIVEENTRHHMPLAMPFGTQLALPPYQVIRSWSDNLVLLRQALVDLRDVWDVVAPETIPCPISFTKKSSDSRNQSWRHTRDYPQVVDTWSKRRREWNELERGGPFPYDDGMFSFFLS